MKKAFIVTNAASMVHLFNEDNINLLLEKGYEVHIACNFEKNNTIDSKQVEKCRKEWEIRGLFLYQFPIDRSPFKICNIKAYKVLKEILKNTHFDIIHCHNPVVSVITRLAADKYRKKGTKVIYTAHGFYFYKGAKMRDWLIYYPVEKYFAGKTDVLVTINKEDYELAKSRFNKAGKVFYTNSVGIDYNKFAECDADKLSVRNEYGLKENDKVLLSVGELSDRKNHRVIIEAMAMLRQADLHYVVAGIGEKRDELLKLAEKYGLEKNVHFIGFVKDIARLHRVADVFCFPSDREGLPIALVEAAASGLACVAAKIRGNTDIVDDENGFLCNVHSVREYAAAIKELISNETLRKEKAGKIKKSAAPFDVSCINDAMREVYDYCGDSSRKEENINV